MQAMNRKTSFHIPHSYHLQSHNSAYNDHNFVNNNEIDFHDPKNSKRTAASNKAPVIQPR